MSKKKMN